MIVRIVADDEARFHVESYIPFFDGLEEAGIIVIDDDLPSAIMHNKYFIIDGEYVWTGSTNMTNNGFTLNHNNGLLFRNTEVADLYQLDFNQMWAGLFSTAKSEPTTTTLDYRGKPLDIYFSPTADVLEAMVTLVNSATISIDFAIFFFTNDSLRDALIAAHDRGVQVRGIWDKLGSSNAFSDDDALCEAGIAIKIEETRGKMHHKFMVIDAATLNARTVTGSLNWTNAGNGRNSENTTVLYDPVIGQLYADAFQEMWASQGPETECRVVTQTFIPFTIDTSRAIVRIDHIVYNPEEGEDVDGEYIRIHNIGGAATELTNWTLRDVADNTYTFPTITIQSSQAITIWTRIGEDDESNLYWGRSGSAIWNNRGDTAWLYTDEGIARDVCAYPGGAIEVECD
ncbi:MAG: phospholipase D-like domain-containing protein [Chloroflexota bacterium]